jgi:GTP cyclohydrolase I
VTTREQAVEGIRAVLSYLDEMHGEALDPEVHEHTPDRWVTFLEAATAGMMEPPVETVRFAVDGSGSVQIAQVVFHSLCEHHLLPFFGTVTIDYLPIDCVVGISSLVHVIERHSRRLQLQERMTRDIAVEVAQLTGVRWARVQVVAEHLCMSMRGVMKPGSQVTTQFVSPPSVREDERS